MQITPSIFWDTQYEKIDWAKNASYVIDRVLHYGTWGDWKSIQAFYGRQKIEEVTLRLRYMDKRVLAYCSVYLNIPKEKFRCFNTEPLLQKQWSF